MLDAGEADDFVSPNGIASRFLGRVTFDDARKVQEEFVQKRRMGEVSDLFLFCEHPPTLSFGKRSRTEDQAQVQNRDAFQAIVFCDRGGKATYHGPGQLVIYPVICLTTRRLGVRLFTQLGLGAIADVLSSFGIESTPLLDPAGVWVERRDATQAKIASVGLRITGGVTNHGFSLNVAGDLSPFSWFRPCGHTGLQVTSIEQEQASAPPLDVVAEAVLRSFERYLEPNFLVSQ